MATVSPNRTMTVVQLIPTLHSGGAERSTLEIARALVAAGHRSVVVSAGGRLVAQLEAEGSEHFTVPIGHKSLRTLFTVGTLRRILREVKPDTDEAVLVSFDVPGSKNGLAELSITVMRTPSAMNS